MKSPMMKSKTPLLRNKLCVALMTAGLAIGSGQALAGDNGSDTAAKMKQGWIEGKLETIYLFNPHLNNFEIDADVRGNTVILNGEVDEDVDKELAEAIAKGIDGIEKVENRLVVTPDKAKDQTEKANGKSALAQKFDDITVTTVVKSKLLKSDHVPGLTVDVDTRDGVVTLSGEVESSAAKNLAEQLAQNTDGVTKVHNHLTVKES